MRVTFFSAVMICTLAAAAAAQQAAPTAVAVGTVAAERKPITDALILSAVWKPSIASKSLRA